MKQNVLTKYVEFSSSQSVSSRVADVVSDFLVPVTPYSIQTDSRSGSRSGFGRTQFAPHSLKYVTSSGRTLPVTPTMNVSQPALRMRIAAEGPFITGER